MSRFPSFQRRKDRSKFIKISYFLTFKIGRRFRRRGSLFRKPSYFLDRVNILMFREPHLPREIGGTQPGKMMGEGGAEGGADSYKNLVKKKCLFNRQADEIGTVPSRKGEGKQGGIERRGPLYVYLASVCPVPSSLLDRLHSIFLAFYSADFAVGSYQRPTVQCTSTVLVADITFCDLLVPVGPTQPSRIAKTQRYTILELPNCR